MSRSSRTSAATQRPKATPADQGPTSSYLPDEVVAFLTEGGWVHAGADKPTALSLWAHETKAGGNPLPAEQAYEFEARAREATAVQNDGAEGDEAKAARLEAENAAEAQAVRAREAAAEASAVAAAEAQRAEVAEGLRRRIDAAERAAAEAAAVPDPEFVHDGIGAVSIWRCYRCDFTTRYAATCPCDTCVAITAAIACPNCGDKQPNMDPSRR